MNEGKLEPRAKKGLFVGYPEGVKWYRIWSEEKKKCIISKDVKFHESELLGDNKPREIIDCPTRNDEHEIEVELENNSNFDNRAQDLHDQTEEPEHSESDKNSVDDQIP